VEILPDQAGRLFAGKGSEEAYVLEAVSCVSEVSCAEWGSEHDYGCGPSASSAPPEICPGFCSDPRSCRCFSIADEETCLERSYRSLQEESGLSPAVGYALVEADSVLGEEGFADEAIGHRPAANGRG